MKWKKYPKYKESGVEWLGEIPEGWEVKRMRFFTKINPKKSEQQGINFDLDVSFLPMEAIGEYGGLKLDYNKKIEEVYNGYTYFKEGDIIVAKITPCFENGKGAVVNNLTNEIGFGTTELHVIRATKTADTKYLFYISITDHFRKIGSSFMYGAGGQKRVPEEFVLNFRHPLPERKEQIQIAQFLDHETSRIDNLIEKKRRQIELLKEKRSALITHVITKGLNPNAKMKDSGVKWIGKIPEHWEIKRLKYFVIKIGSGKTPKGGSEIYVDSGIMLLRSQNVHFDGLHLDDVVYIDGKIDAEMSNTRVKDFDILLNITGASIGRVAIYDEKNGLANVNQHVCIIRPDQRKIVAKYLWLSICSKLLQSQILASEVGTSREGLNFQQVGNLKIILPSDLKEQIQIVEFLDKETSQIDTLISKIQISIDKLKEYRAALISAAVTGKIDVRNWKNEGALCQ